MNRIKAILAAGTLTGLVAVTAVVLGLGQAGVNTAAANDPAAAPSVIVNPVVLPAETDGLGSAETQAQIEAMAATAQAVSVQAAQTGQTAQAYQAYAQQLEAAVQVMQSREAEYQAQIEAANQTILQLQDQINSQTSAQAAVAQPPAIIAPVPPVTSSQSGEREGNASERSEHENGEHEEYDND